MGRHVPHLFKLLPANVALVRVPNQRPPLRSGLAPTAATGFVLAHTAGNVRFGRTHTPLHMPGSSTWCRWWSTEVVARPPGRAGRKREPPVRVPETKAGFAVRSRVRRTC